MANYVSRRIFLISVSFFITNQLLFSNLVFGHEPFGYGDDNGPNHWPEEYDTCVGKHQSPINILEHQVKSVNLPPLKFGGLDTPQPAYITNNGHTVMFKLNESERAHITGGPLEDSIYIFEQLHFHWGEHDKEGSEDLINNHSFAMELHAVFYKQDYGTFKNAIHNSDGLTVLAYFFEASNDPNPTFDSIVNTIPRIEEVNAYQKLAEPLQLKELLTPDGVNVQNYFTYHGSLTTPPCLEIVTWIDFKDPLRLSHEQIATFRDIQTSKGDKLKRNFRPVQPLEGRIVYLNQIGEGMTVPEFKPKPLKYDKDSEEVHIKMEHEFEQKEHKSDVENDIDGTFKEDEDEDPEKYTSEEIDNMMDEHAADDTSGKVQMIINIFVTLSTLCTIFAMR